MDVSVQTACLRRRGGINVSGTEPAASSVDLLSQLLHTSGRRLRDHEKIA
jgi:hypothetical protein